MSTLKSPRPTPQFFKEAQTFSTKKERGTPREAPPPRPPVKSCPPVSRIFHHKQVQRAQAVSFRGSVSDHSVLSSHYDQGSKELFFDQCFVVCTKLGAGSFGEVFKVQSKEDGKYYAVKRSRERFRGESDRKRKLEEVAKHETLPKHPNCVEFVRAWEERQHLYIQTELCQTSLNNYAESHHDIPESLVWNYMVDLLMAVKHLHDHDLVHMDIKSENIFISSDGVCKLGDFGLVIDLKKKADMSDAIEGDPKYMAPELLEQEGKFGKPADVFSLGITILELTCDLDLPRGGEGWHQLRTGCLPQKLLKGKSPELIHIIKWMMEPDDRLRPTADQLLSHSYVRNVWKRRKRQQMFKKWVGSVQYLYEKTLAFFLLLWFFLSLPFVKIFKTTKQTPVKIHIPKQHPSEWDHSFSDDEIFEDNSINLHDNSMVAPLDTSTSSDDMSRNGTFAIPSLPVRPKTTPSARHRPQRRSTPRTRSPVCNLNNIINRYTPETSPSIGFRSDVSGTTPPNTNFLADEEDPKLIIGPKNLMQMFEAASDEED
ncbi:membrane-associated tyrosine- and threonine-specific cdc2-inhibitory kinase [Lingula anatina]|uniref:Membrane-associated tyrosine- and threonine-specific cdc2-inhibitory kinase n=1 Tax=Lingula anatina TaxID=7574 RepID=A0A1S3JAL1_LINAN|nr:membrane-associated tyrosine- and threonine-specific cdc2-inhibitory kinase [Lingula anatina]|eukprot:XP_013407437.1 membrane-associated tyrosine- and threonine-specific cdc2-inhibitory kinase [Lingula anatina]